MSNTHFDLVAVGDSFADSDWFRICRAQRRPYIVVRQGPLWSDVLWDFVTLPETCDTRIRQRFTQFEHDARAIFERYATAESWLRIKPTLIGFDRLPRDQAPSAAKELHTLITSYLPVAVVRSTQTEMPIIPPAKRAEATTNDRSATRKPPLWVEEQVSTSSAA